MYTLTVNVFKISRCAGPRPPPPPPPPPPIIKIEGFGGKAKENKSVFNYTI